MLHDLPNVRDKQRAGAGVKGLTFIVDGITLQHAGELFFDATESSRVRRECSTAYVRGAEDAAFAALFAEQFLYLGSLPQVGDEYPGEQLLLRLRRNAPVKRRHSGRPADFISKYPSFAGTVGIHLENVSHSNRDMWEDFFVRDAHYYLGDHNSIRDPTVDRDQYMFAKFEQNGPDTPENQWYTHNRPLQDLLDKRFVSQMVKRLRPTCPPDVVDLALHEFVQRAALTHITISEWYDVVYGRSLTSRRARMPFGTRASLAEVWLERFSFRASGVVGTKEQRKQAANFEQALETLKTLLVPHALSDAMQRAGGNRQDLAVHLRQMWSERPYRDVRSRLSQAVEAANQGNLKDIDKLAKDIRKLTREASGAIHSDELRITVFGRARLKLGPFAELEGGTNDVLGAVRAATREAVDLGRHLDPRRWRLMLRKIARRTPSDRYHQQLAAYFPELDMDRVIAGRRGGRRAW